MGTKPDFAQSDSLFCGDYPDGDAERRDIFGYFQAVFYGRFLCSCLERDCGLELQKSELKQFLNILDLHHIKSI